MRKIFIGGHGRSGTTWIARTLSKRCKIGLLFEPYSSQFQFYTGYDTQSLLKNCRRVNLNKQGKIVHEKIQKNFFLLEEDDYSSEIEEILSGHLSQLVKKSGLDSEKSILVKQPRAEVFGLLERSIGQCFSIFIDRDPIGIVGSYFKGNYWHWMVEDYENLTRSEDERLDLYQGAIAAAKSKYERTFLLSVIRSRELSAYCEKHESLRLQYEELCMQPDLIQKLINKFGLNSLSSDSAASNHESFEDPYFKRMFDTKKVSSTRVDGWKTELPPGALKEINTFCENWFPGEFPRYEHEGGIKWLKIVIKLKLDRLERRYKYGNCK